MNAMKYLSLSNEVTFDKEAAFKNDPLVCLFKSY